MLSTVAPQTVWEDRAPIRQQLDNLRLIRGWLASEVKALSTPFYDMELKTQTENLDITPEELRASAVYADLNESDLSTEIFRPLLDSHSIYGRWNDVSDDPNSLFPVTNYTAIRLLHNLGILEVNPDRVSGMTSAQLQEMLALNYHTGPRNLRLYNDSTDNGDFHRMLLKTRCLQVLPDNLKQFYLKTQSILNGQFVSPAGDFGTLSGFGDYYHFGFQSPRLGPDAHILMGINLERDHSDPEAKRVGLQMVFQPSYHSLDVYRRSLI